MSNERIRRRDDKAATAVSKAFVTDMRFDRPGVSESKEVFGSRIFTLVILSSDATKEFCISRSRSRAFLLVMTVDFCWQVIRYLGGVTGDDRKRLDEALPKDHAQSDKDVGDDLFRRQIEIVEDAKWIHQIHSFIRHPQGVSAENVWILREPISDEHAARLVRAAKGVHDVLVKVAGRK